MSDLTVTEMEDSVKNSKIYDNAIVIANILELTTSVIANMATSDISDSLEKETLSKSVLTRLAANNIMQFVEESLNAN
jgi:hypothetical protein